MPSWRPRTCPERHTPGPRAAACVTRLSPRRLRPESTSRAEWEAPLPGGKFCADFWFSCAPSPQAPSAEPSCARHRRGCWLWSSSRGGGASASPGVSGLRGEATLSRGDDGTEAKLAVTGWRRRSMSHWGLEKSHELPERPSASKFGCRAITLGIKSVRNVLTVGHKSLKDRARRLCVHLRAPLRLAWAAQPHGPSFRFPGNCLCAYSSLSFWALFLLVVIPQDSSQTAWKQRTLDRPASLRFHSLHSPVAWFCFFIACISI